MVFYLKKRNNCEKYRLKNPSTSLDRRKLLRSGDKSPSVAANSALMMKK